MLIPSLLIPLLVAAGAAPAGPQRRGKVEPPPGMVLIEGGTTKIGTPVKEVEELSVKNEYRLAPLVPETPRHEVRVEDFFVLVTEVTNEQYAAYVRATGARPPVLWGAKAIEEGRRAFLEEQGRKKKEAREAGKPVPETRTFDDARWWRQNWEGKPWEVPKGKESHPVVYVDHRESQDYARWAGVRLPTEFEYQRAARGNTGNAFPWGDDWDPRKAAVVDHRISEALAVGSLPAGATPQGVFDLAGNCWEWTSSPFVPYPGYKDLQIEIGKGSKSRKIAGIASWDANQRVVVGGCFQETLLAARVAIRRGTERFQSTNSLSFRCAASFQPGLDIARTVLDEDLPADRRPPEVIFDEKKVLAIDHWASEPGTAAIALDDGPQPMPNYAIITSYDYVLFFPAMEVESTTLKALGELSLEKGPVHLGVFSSTVDMIEPPLPAGSYFVTYRGPGEPRASPAPPAAGGEQGSRRQDAAAQPAAPVVRLPEGLDKTVAQLIFYDAEGNPVASMRAPDLEYARPSEPEALIARGTRQIQSTDEDGKPVVIEEPATILTFKVNSWVKVSNKGFRYPLLFKLAPEAITNDWRH